MLQRPSFKNEYSCLSRDLSAVPFWIKWRGLEDKLTELQLQKDRLTREAIGADKALQVLKAGVKRKFLGVPKEDDAAKRLEILSRIGSEIADRETAPTRLPYNNTDAIDCVTVMYSTFDVGRFEDEWASLFGGVDKESLQKVNGSLGGTEKALKAHRASVSACFEGGRIPLRWRAMHAPEGKPEALIEVGITIVDQFIRDWKYRASQFEEPVTIGGISIYTMAPQARQVWKEMYDLLKLGELKKKVIYKAMKAEITSPEQKYSLSTFAG